MPILPDVPQAEAAIVTLTNAFRQENHLGAVAPNAQLAAAARWFAEYLAKSDKFAHEADGREPQQRAEAAGYKYCMVAENLALNLDSRGFTSAGLATAVVEGWKASPGHRRNLLEPAVTEIGVAVARAPTADPKFISVQLFGRPESLKITFKIENMTQVSVSYALGDEEQVIKPRTIVTQQTCGPDALAFVRAGGWLSGNDIGARFAPENGAVFVLRVGDDGLVHVDRASTAAPQKR